MDWAGNVTNLNLNSNPTDYNILRDMLGINGFGRIGRLVLRAAFEGNTGLKIGAINDPNMDLKYLLYQLKYDSAHGRFNAKVENWEKGIVVNGHKIQVHNQKNPV